MYPHYFYAALRDITVENAALIFSLGSHLFSRCIFSVCDILRYPTPRRYQIDPNLAMSASFVL